MLYKKFLLGFISLFFVGSVFSQPGPKLRIVVGAIANSAEPCAVRVENARGIAGFILNSARISQAASDDYSANILSINQLVIYDRPTDSCYGSARVEVYGFALADFTEEPLRGFKSKSRNTVLCEATALRGGPRALFSSDLNRMLEDLIKQCIGGLRY
jgi:hypothetical protein